MEKLHSYNSCIHVMNTFNCLSNRIHFSELCAQIKLYSMTALENTSSSTHDKNPFQGISFWIKLIEGMQIFFKKKYLVRAFTIFTSCISCLKWRLYNLIMCVCRPVFCAQNAKYINCGMHLIHCMQGALKLG